MQSAPCCIAFAQGAYLWNWKDSIDRAFMRKYSDDLDAMRDKMMKSEGQAAGGCEMARSVR